jgi:ubiquinone/menaquinone biosynthesis C-methylase UbiE
MKSKETILNFWNRVIQIYSPEIGEWIKQENLYLKKRIKKGSVVLDVGFGDGKTILEIKDTAETIIGIDKDGERFEKYKKELSKFNNIEVFLEKAQDMHFKDDTFDYVICMGNTFGNFGKIQKKALSEMKRVVKVGGIIFISVYSENALSARLDVYKKAGLSAKVISEDGTMLLGEHVFSEQFTKQKLRKVFDKAELKADIIELTHISYICELSKS